MPRTCAFVTSQCSAMPSVPRAVQTRETQQRYTPILDRETQEGKTMSFVKGLQCRECGQEYPQEPLHVCDNCFGPLEIQYDYEGIKKNISREKIAARDHNLWRYRELLPIDGEPGVGLYSGFTPLVRAHRLAEALGVQELYLQDDSVNHPS